MLTLQTQLTRISNQRANAIDDMLCEVLSRPECYDVARLLLVTYVDDSWTERPESASRFTAKPLVVIRNGSLPVCGFAGSLT
jgi:hypothetical protein